MRTLPFNNCINTCRGIPCGVARGRLRRTGVQRSAEGPRQPGQLHARSLLPSSASSFPAVASSAASPQRHHQQQHYQRPFTASCKQCTRSFDHCGCVGVALRCERVRRWRNLHVRSHIAGRILLSSVGHSSWDRRPIHQLLKRTFRETHLKRFRFFGLKTDIFAVTDCIMHFEVKYGRLL